MWLSSQGKQGFCLDLYTCAKYTFRVCQGQQCDVNKSGNVSPQSPSHLSQCFHWTEIQWIYLWSTAHDFTDNSCDLSHWRVKMRSKHCQLSLELRQNVGSKRANTHVNPIKVSKMSFQQRMDVPLCPSKEMPIFIGKHSMPTRTSAPTRLFCVLKTS